MFVKYAGDTRAVLSRNGQALRLSKDHKPSDDEDRINALGGWVMASAGSKRVNGLVAVSRSIGDYFLEPFIHQEPEIKETDLTSSDEFLILACDGLWDVVSDQEAVDIVLQEKDPWVASIKLRDRAYSLTSEDNISVVIVRFK